MKIAVFLYFIDVLSYISCFLRLIAIVGFFMVVLIVIFIGMPTNEYTDNALYRFFVKHVKKIIASWLCLLLLCALLPKKELMYLAGGLYLGNEALENPKVKALLEKSYRILDDKLDTMLKKIEGPELLKSKE